jgi:hypothetical protein
MFDADLARAEGDNPDGVDRVIPVVVHEGVCDDPLHEQGGA